MIKIRNAIAIISLILYIWAPIVHAGFLVVGNRNGSQDSPDNLTFPLLPYSSTGAVLTPGSTLQDTGINLPIATFDSRGGLFCKDALFYSRYTFKLSHNLVPGPVFNGHQLFKTSLQGLYFDVQIIDLRGAYSTFSPNTFYLSNNSQITKAKFTESCGSYYYEIGGVIFNFQVRYYTDATFQHAQDRSNSNSFLATFASNGNIPGAPFPGPGMRFENDAGSGSYWTISLPSQLYISPPTCYATAVSGPHTSGNTVDLGTWASSEVQNNLTPARPFNIELSGCLKTTKATFRLTTNVPAPLAPHLLGNALTESSAAQGAGVKIVGLGGPGYELQANNTSSTYPIGLTYSGESYAEYVNGKIAMTGSQMSVPFTAQLVRAGNATVKPGSFKASAIFTVSYN